MGSSPGLEKIRRECQQRGVLWEDPDFEAVNRSLFYSGNPLTQPITWMRPVEVARQNGMKATLFADFKDMRFSLIQGQLGDCWLVASLASLATEGLDMINRVIPIDQSFSSAGGYCGAFRVNFWRFGRWVEVLVDDRLPTINGQLIFIHSNEKNEFWGCLVEKAYAKLNGCYEALRAGLMGDALDDLSGGITESFIFKMADTVPSDLVRLLFKAFDRHGLIGTGIDGDGQARKMSNGLVSGHAYTFVDIRKLKLQLPGASKTEKTTLVKIRNPWGSAVEWNGAWSDRSVQWSQLTPNQRQEIGLVLRDDGEFWIDWNDYRQNFSTLYVCHLPPSLAPRRISHTHGSSSVPVGPPAHWTVAEWRGQWIKGRTDGGRPFLQDTFWRNPQYRFQLYPCADPGDTTPETTACIIGLQQRDIRRELPQGAQYLSIGFVIYRLTPGKRYPDPLPQNWFQRHPQYIGSVYFFTAARSNVRSFELPPGEYFVVPCTYDAGRQGDFLLRVFMEKGSFRTEEGTWKGGLPSTASLSDSPGVSPLAPPVVHSRNTSAVSTSSRSREVQFNDEIDHRQDIIEQKNRQNRRQDNRRQNGFFTNNNDTDANNGGVAVAGPDPAHVTASAAAPAPAPAATPPTSLSGSILSPGAVGGSGSSYFLPESEIRRVFQSVVGQSLTLDAWQLQRLLNKLLANEPRYKSVDLSACRALVFLVQADAGSNTSGVSYHEFVYLWTNVTSWAREFGELDTNGSGVVPCQLALSQILPRQQGLELSDRLIETLQRRFADPRAQLGFSEFVAAIAATMTASALFKKSEHLGVAMLNQEEFMNCCFTV